MKKLLNRRRLAGLAIAFALTASAPPAAAADSPVEAANKQVVLDFYAALNDADAAGAMKDRIQGIAEKYLSPGYVQHAETFANLPGPGAPREKLVRMFQNMPAGQPALPPAKTVAIMAEGDMVMMLTSRDVPNPAGGAKTSYIFNMFRVKDGQLIEHWDVSPALGGPPPAPGGAPPPGAR